MLLLFFKFCTRFKSDLCTYFRTLHNSKFIFLPLRRSFMFLSCFCCSLSSFCFNLKDALQPFFFFFQPVCFLLIPQWSDLDHVLHGGHNHSFRCCCVVFKFSSYMLSWQCTAHIFLGCSSRGLCFVPL